MANSTSPPPPAVVIEGSIMGLMDLAGPTTWGIIQLHPEGDAVRFTMSIDLTGKSSHEIAQIDAARIAAAVEAAVAANCDVAVRANVEGMHRPNATGGRRVTKLQSTSWEVRVLAKTDADSVQRAAATAALVLQGGRPQQLHNVYLLGVRAMQTIAPVVGLWAFTTVLEEVGTGKHNVDHVPQMASDLRRKGFSIPPDPIRHPAEIRAAALHSTPRSPMPTLDEVSWFRDVAWAYLCDQALTHPSPT